MRFIGKCPFCGVPDTIVAGRPIDGTYVGHKEANCESCGYIWTEQEIRQGLHLNKDLIRVEIVCARWWAGLVSPTDNRIPAARLIKSVANSALIVNFDLKVCLACEGGVYGTHQNEPIELDNDTENIQLWDDLHLSENPVCLEILTWYTDLLRYLFVEELFQKGQNLGRGAILKLDASDPEWYDLKAKSLLWVALSQKTGDEGFTKTVFDRLILESSRPSGIYLAGLTDDEIAKRFIDPPIWEGR